MLLSTPRFPALLLLAPLVCAAGCGRFATDEPEATPTPTPQVVLKEEALSLPILLNPTDSTELVRILGSIEFGEVREGLFPDDARFVGYAFQATEGSVVDVGLENTSDGSTSQALRPTQGDAPEDADPVVGLYGPQDDTGLWGSAIAQDDDSGEGLAARIAGSRLEEGGHYLILMRAHFHRRGWRFRLTLRCEGEACASRDCDEPLCRQFCGAGFRYDENGCRRCECVEQCAEDRDCPAGQRCMNGACRAIPDPCAGAFDPVCGDDGVDYPSPCHADRAGVRSRPGRCDPDEVECRLDADCDEGEVCARGVCLRGCDCPEDLYLPVCGLRGDVLRNYRNDCYMACDGAELAHPEECTGRECQIDANGTDPCPEGLRCLPWRGDPSSPVGECLPADLCDRPCPPGFVADPAQRCRCVPDPACEEIGACEPGCVAVPDPDTGCPTCQCREGACTTDNQCEGGQHCLQPRECEMAGAPLCPLPGECRDNVLCGGASGRECPEGQRCSIPPDAPRGARGVCVAQRSCRGDFECPDRQGCALFLGCADFRSPDGAPVRNCQPRGEQRCRPACRNNGDCDGDAICSFETRRNTADSPTVAIGVCVPGRCDPNVDANTCPEGYHCAVRLDAAGNRVSRCAALRGPCQVTCRDHASCADRGGARLACLDNRCVLAGCDLNPVCGSDGVSYPSGCDVPWCRGVEAESSGECPFLKRDENVGCGADIACPPGAACVEGECIEREGEPCTPARGQCGRAGVCVGEGANDAGEPERFVCRLRCMQSPDGANTCPGEQRCVSGVCRARAAVDTRRCRQDADCGDEMRCDAGECKSAQCRRTGCNLEMCADRELDTSCEMHPEYRCLELARCVRATDGPCVFSGGEAYERCRASFGAR